MYTQENKQKAGSSSSCWKSTSVWFKKNIHI